jgi:L-fuconolactonase
VIVDGHVHFWDPVARHHGWLDEQAPLRRRFGPEDLDVGHHELAGVVFVEADCRPEEALEEVRWVTALAREYPLIRGIVAHAPLRLGRAAASHLTALASEPLVVGVRHLLQGGSPEAPADRGLISGVRMLPEWRLTFDVCVTHEQLPAVATLIEACPRTTFVLDHLGKPPVASGRLDPWREHVTRIAALPNVVCKLSGLASEAAPGWRDGDVRPYLDHALEAFGARRCMVGSDWPVATLRTTTERWFDVVCDAIAGLSEEDRRWVLGETAVTTYGLVPSGPQTEPIGDARSPVRR